jgi:hypothetical protein
MLQRAGHPADVNCAAIRPYITGKWRSDCRPGDPQTTGDYPWCGKDELELVVQGRSLRVTHRNATYNCCLDDIVVTLDSQGALLRFCEQEALTFPCFLPVLLRRDHDGRGTDPRRLHRRVLLVDEDERAHMPGERRDAAALAASTEVGKDAGRHRCPLDAGCDPCEIRP